MKANELRLGNYVLTVDNVFGEVFSIDGAEIMMLNYPYTDIITFTQPIDVLRGIPITEEWLVDSGFKLTTNSGYWKQDLKYYSGVIMIYIDGNTGKFYLGQNSRDYDCEQFNDYEIKYVHQLQNLCFALTGEYLIIKE